MRIPPARPPAFSRDGKSLDTGSADRTARLWNVATGQSRPPLWGHADQVTAVASVPDGHPLATAGPDSTALLWAVDPPGLPRRSGGSAVPSTVIWPSKNGPPTCQRSRQARSAHPATENPGGMTP
ncbi:hypothetical protein ABTX82_33435 [Streptomyces lavendulae]|uniref:WD40 repeat domain-containing protein n=1 Tax=Streptomyces lavendulae TaxID=1914 RepID=UPI003333FD8D